MSLPRFVVVLLTLLLTACAGATGADSDASVADARAAADAPARADARERRDGPRADASTIDASTIDASTIDASTIDASTVDASTVDAGTTDASTIDASAPDASAPDASAPDASAPDASAPDASAPDAGGVVAYSHTIVIDGTNDFAVADERFTTSSAGYYGYAAWDAQYLYLAMEGSDVASKDSARFWLVYLSGTPGTTTGEIYNTQQPALPFSTTYHLRWKADNSFTNALVWSGSAWSDGGWSFTGNVFQSSTFVEMRIPWAELGDPAQLSVAVAMINETDGAEATFAGVPSASFFDGPNPTWTRYFTFDRSLATKPAAYLPLP